MRLCRLELTNFLSYRQASLELGDLVALVGPNASGKSNLAAALKLLADIPTFGLPTALLRRGGFDQLRHRSGGHPYNPSIAIEFQASPDDAPSRYELRFAAVAGGLYSVKSESGHVRFGADRLNFTHRDGHVDMRMDLEDETHRTDEIEIPEGQSALPVTLGWGGYHIWNLLNALQVVEINPTRIRDLQDPTPGYQFEPDGSNAVSVFEGLSRESRRRLIDELAAVVPGIENIEVRRFANKLTLQFTQMAGQKRREFLASQMSDGTLRAFGIILALVQRPGPAVLVVEEPEVAIHLGALRTLVDIFRSHSEDVQILLTTHSADIIDALETDDIRVIWAEDGVSHVSAIATHTVDTIRTGLIGPGELLRSDALDPASS